MVVKSVFSRRYRNEKFVDRKTKRGHKIVANEILGMIYWRGFVKSVKLRNLTGNVADQRFY